MRCLPWRPFKPLYFWYVLAERPFDIWTRELHPSLFVWP